MSNPVVIGNAELWLGDCLEILPTLSKVDAVVTDPPYGAEVHAAGKRVKATGLSRVIIESPLPFPPLTTAQRDGLIAWCGQRCSGWLIAFHQCEHSGDWKNASQEAGLKYRRTMVWVKPDSPPQLSGDRPAQGFEAIHASWCGEGKSIWSGGGRRGVFNHATLDDNDGKSHPTCKPEALMKELVSLFSATGSCVLDPFMGSGTTGVACMNLGRKFIGIEIEEKYFDIACARIEQAQKQVRMFA